MRWIRAIGFASMAAGCAPGHVRPSSVPALDRPNSAAAASVDSVIATTPTALRVDSIRLRARRIELRVGEEYDLLALTPPVRLYADGSQVQLWRWEMMLSVNGVYAQGGRPTRIRATRPGQADIVFLERETPTLGAARASGRVTITVVP